MSATPRIGVVVLDFGRPQEAARAARSAQQDGLETRILIVENGVGSASEADGRLRLAENLGFAGGMNAGLRRLLDEGCGKILLLNNDAELEPGCLSLLAQALDDPTLAAVGPVIVRAHDGRVESRGIDVETCWGRVRLHGQGAFPPERQGLEEVAALSGAVLMLSRAAVERVGLLDEAYFFSFEDVDWCLRAREAGLRVAVVLDARARHVGSLSLGRVSPERFYYATRNHLRLVERRQPLVRLVHWLRRAAVLALNLGHALRQVEVPRREGLRAALTGFSDACHDRFGPRPRWDKSPRERHVDSAGGRDGWLAAPGRFGVALVAAALIELFLITLPDTMGDLLEYRRWTRLLVAGGLEGAYWPPQPTTVGVLGESTWAIDYPPVFPYLLWLVGRGLERVSPGALAKDTLVDAVIRLPLLVAHWLCGLVIYGFVRRRLGLVAGRWAMLLHVLNPALVFDTCYWGQSDALVALGLVASVVAVVERRSGVGWALMAVTVLIKPLAVPFVALLAVVDWREGGWRRLVRNALLASGATLVTLAPFVWMGRLGDILRACFLQVDAMPYASVNAHNLWWLVTGGLPWTLADAPFFLGVSYRLIGLLLFAAFLVATLVWLWRTDESRGLPLAAAGTALALFVLNTHMHENHLYVFLPLLALVCLSDRRLRWLYAAATLSLLLNMSIHDPYLRWVLGPSTPGPRVLRPPAGPLGPELVSYLVRSGYAYVVELHRGETTIWRLVAAQLGSLANVALLVCWPLVVRRRVGRPGMEAGA